MVEQALVQTLLLLGVTVFVVLLFQRFRIPPSLAYLLVGVIFGSHTAGPAIDTTYIQAIAEFGIVFLLFTIGLSFPLPQVYALRHTILGLGMEVFLWGIVGARLFYVIEYYGQFFAPGRSWLDSIAAVLNVAAGGLVVFGALPTAAVAAWRFAHRRGLPLLQLADCIAPGLLLGLAIGRLGCFLNGCCYGGPCDLPWAVSFPPDSPPWLDQMARGLLADTPGLPRPRSLPVHPAQVYAAMQGLGWLTVYSAALRPIWSLFHAFALVLGLWLMWRADLPPWVQAWGRYTWQRILRMAQRLGSAQVGAPFLTGALWAFLPCGLLYSALVVAALAAQAWQGAVVMATFALFSAAVLALGPWVLLRWGRSLRASALGMRLAGLALSLSSGSALYLGLFHNQAPWCV